MVTQLGVECRADKDCFTAEVLQREPLVGAQIAHLRAQKHVRERLKGERARDASPRRVLGRFAPGERRAGLSALLASRRLCAARLWVSGGRCGSHLGRTHHTGRERKVEFLALAAEQPHPARAELVHLVDGIEARIQLVGDQRRVEQKPGFQALAAAPHPRILFEKAHVGRACRKVFGVYPALSLRAAYAPPNRRWPMILSALAEKLKRRSKDDFKGRHFEATLIVQAVSWYLRYPLSYSIFRSSCIV